jgi:hypothetical protein
VYFDTAVRSHEDGVNISLAFQLVIPLLPHLQLFQLKRWEVINDTESIALQDQILSQPHLVRGLKLCIQIWTTGLWKQGIAS